MRDSAATRARIAAAALSLFAEKGVAETSIRDIAEAAGVAEGALYRHYAGKDDLVWTLFSTNYAEFAATLAGLAADSPHLLGQIDAMVRGFCRLFDADRALFSFLLLVQHGQLARIPAGMETPVKVIRRAIAAAMDRGEIPRSDADLLTAMVMGVVLQTATFVLYGRIQAPMAALADTLAAACWRVLTV